MHTQVHINAHKHKHVHQDMSNNDHSDILGSILELNKPIGHHQENDTEINETNVSIGGCAQEVKCLSCKLEDPSSSPVPTEKLGLVALEGSKEMPIPGAHWPAHLVSW